MLRRCRANPDNYWELVALVDQYRRRGHLGHYDFGPLKSQLELQVLSIPLPAPGVRTPRAADNQAAAGGKAARRVTAIPVLHNKAPRPIAASTRARTETGERRETVEFVSGSVEAPVARLAFSRLTASVTSGGSAQPPAKYPHVGSVLRNRFVLEEVLGAGGMGTVFKALDRNRQDLPGTGRYVALKLLHESLAHRPAAVERLRNEYLQIQRLSHSGIVNVFDFDSEAGTPFFTMEWLQGELLSDIMARLSPSRIKRGIADAVLGELASAISYAHDRGTLHADLKPGNIMITDRGELRVLDFGIATQTRCEPWIGEPVDSFDAVTLAYASRERLMGHPPQVRDDVYSFACLAYELLAGAHPFDHLQALEARERGMKPHRIPELSRRQWRALRQALSWERGDRPDSLAELAQALMSDSPLQRLPAPPRWQVRKPVRNRAGAFVWLGAAIVAGAVAGLTLWPEADLPPEVVAVKRQFLASGGAVATMARPAIDAIRHVQATLSAVPRSERTRTAPAVGTSSATVAVPAQESPAAAQPADDAEVPARIREEKPAASPSPPAISGRLEMGASTSTVLESEPVARVLVERRGATDGSVSFSWRTAPGTALENDDYAAFGWVTEVMAAGQSTATLLVPLVRDSDAEGAETFFVEISEPRGQVRLGAVTRTTIVIEDDDAARPADQ